MPFFMFSFYLANAVAGGPVFILALCPASAHPTCAAAVATLEGAGNQPPTPPSSCCYRSPIRGGRLVSWPLHHCCGPTRGALYPSHYPSRTVGLSSPRRGHSGVTVFLDPRGLKQLGRQFKRQQTTS